MTSTSLALAPARTDHEFDWFERSLITSDRPRDPAPRPHLRGALRWLIRLVVLGVAIAAPVLAFAGEREVSLDVEGKIARIRTYATSPSDLLVRAGVPITDQDAVTADDRLDRGELVRVRKAKPVRVVLDGHSERVVAHGLTVGDALSGLGLRPGPKDHVSPDLDTRLRPGMSLYVRNAIHATLRVDGAVRDVVSSADTVGVLLEHAGVEVGPNDYVLPRRDVEPTDGMWIRVVRVRRFVDEETVRIPFRSITQNDPNLESGVRRTAQMGAEGLKVRRYAVVLEDGQRVSTSLIGETTVRQARDHIVRVGTRAPTFTSSGQSQQGIASWFAADGLVAAHRSLPIGSTVKVTAVESGKSVVVKINQRGPFVDGRVIDLSDDAFERLAPLAQGTVKVRVDS